MNIDKHFSGSDGITNKTGIGKKGITNMDQSLLLMTSDCQSKKGHAMLGEML